MQRTMLYHSLVVPGTGAAPRSWPEDNVSVLLREVLDRLAPVAPRALSHAQNFAVKAKHVRLACILHYVASQPMEERALIGAG